MEVADGRASGGPGYNFKQRRPQPGIKMPCQNELSLNLGKSSDGLGICKRHGLRAELLQFIANIFGGGMPLGIGTRIVHGEKKILWQPVNLA